MSRTAGTGVASCTVAVVGAGAVGLLLACLLAQRGIPVLVFERRSERARRARAFGIHPPGLAALESAGVGPAVRQAAAFIRLGVASSGGRELGTVSFGSRPILSLPQDRTEAILQERLEQLAPGALRRGVEVTGLRDDGDRVQLLAGDGAAQPLCTAVFAVGADGVRSTVRGFLGAEWLRRWGSGEYAMADTRLPHDPGEVAVLRLERDGIVESFPLPGGVRRWAVRLPARPESLAAAEFASIVEQRTAVRLDLGLLSAPSVFSARQHLARPFARGRVALAGDAAHEISPIGGQGMNLGWLDALNLDKAIAEALAGPEHGAEPFARYAAQRAAAAARATRRAAFNMAMGAPLSRAGLLARNALAHALAVPGVRGALASAFTMRGL